MEDMRGENILGGLSDYTDPNAPKVIVSKEVKSFECEFEYLYHCILKFMRQEDGVLCTGNIYDPFGTYDSNLEFIAPLKTLEDLQAIVEEYNFAVFNGINRKVNGLEFIL